MQWPTWSVVSVELAEEVDLVVGVPVEALAAIARQAGAAIMEVRQNGFDVTVKAVDGDVGLGAFEKLDINFVCPVVGANLVPFLIPEEVRAFKVRVERSKLSVLVFKTSVKSSDFLSSTTSLSSFLAVIFSGLSSSGSLKSMTAFS